MSRRRHNHLDHEPAANTSKSYFSKKRKIMTTIAVFFPYGCALPINMIIVYKGFELRERVFKYEPKNHKMNDLIENVRRVNSVIKSHCFPVREIQCQTLHFIPQMMRVVKIIKTFLP